MKKLLSLIDKLIKHELITGTFFLFIGGVIGSFLSFVYNLYLARSLNQADYGVYTSLLAFESLIIIPSASLTAVIVRFASHYFAKGEEDKAAHLFKRMNLIWFAVGVLIFLIVYALHPLLLAYLHLKDSILIAIVGLGAAFSYVGVVNTGFLQSLTKFKYLSFSAVVAALFKLVVGLLLVYAGTRAAGALFGAIMLPITAYILGFLPLRNLISKRSAPETKVETKDIVSYTLVAGIGILSLSSFISTDVILVKHFFSAQEAGLYGGLSIVGKVIFYFTVAIPSVMFPLVIKRHAKGENYRSIFYLALLLVFLPSIAITAFYYFFPEFTANLFLGESYLGIAPYLALFGVFLTIFNVLNITVSFFLSLKKLFVSYIVLFFAALQVVLIYLFHADFYQVIGSSIISASLLLLSLLLYYKIQKD